MSDKVDRRKARTARLLKQALLELMEERGMEGITASELTRRADVHRGTFYLHYQGVPHFLDCWREEILRDLQAILNSAKPSLLKEYVEKNEPYPVLIELYEYAQRNSRHLRVMMGDNGDIAFVNALKKILQSYILTRFHSWSRPSTSAAVPIDYLAAYVASVYIGVSQHWLETGMTATPYEMALFMTQIIGSGPLKWSGVIL